MEFGGLDAEQAENDVETVSFDLLLAEDDGFGGEMTSEEGEKHGFSLIFITHSNEFLQVSIITGRMIVMEWKSE